MSPETFHPGKTAFGESIFIFINVLGGSNNFNDFGMGTHCISKGLLLLSDVVGTRTYSNNQNGQFIVVFFVYNK